MNWNLTCWRTSAKLGIIDLFDAAASCMSLRGAKRRGNDMVVFTRLRRFEQTDKLEFIGQLGKRLGPLYEGAVTRTA